MEYIMQSSRLFTAMLLASSMIAVPAVAARHHHHAAAHTAIAASAANMNTENTYAANANANAPNAANTNAMNANAPAPNNPNDLARADSLMQNSQGVVSQMQSDTNVANLMRSAKGVFIIPNSSNASAIGGTSVPGGVLMTRTNGRWSNPVFFSVGGATATQPGTSNGTVALLIMSNRGLSQFRSGRNISLNGKRLHVINYSTSGNTQPAALQHGDLIVWSGSNVNNAAPSLIIRANTAQDQAVYGTNSQQRIAAGHAPLTNQLAVNLANQMPQGQAPAQVGSNQTGTTNQNGMRPG